MSHNPFNALRKWRQARWERDIQQLKDEYAQARQARYDIRDENIVLGGLGTGWEEAAAYFAEERDFTPTLVPKSSRVVAKIRMVDLPDVPYDLYPVGEVEELRRFREMKEVERVDSELEVALAGWEHELLRSTEETPIYDALVEEENALRMEAIRGRIWAQKRLTVGEVVPIPNTVVSQRVEYVGLQAPESPVETPGERSGHQEPAERVETFTEPSTPSTPEISQPLTSTAHDEEDEDSQYESEFTSIMSVMNTSNSDPIPPHALVDQQRMASALMRIWSVCEVAQMFNEDAARTWEGTHYSPANVGVPPEAIIALIEKEGIVP